MSSSRFVARVPARLTQDKHASPAAPAAQAEDDCRTCRLCWGEEDTSMWGGELVSPCRCSGSLEHIHRRCLADWQRTLRAQGLGRRAAHCELCKAPYSLPPPPPGSSAARARGGRAGGAAAALPRQLAAAARFALADAARAHAWPGIALRAWKAYVMANGVVSALRLGATGFSAGMGVGRALVEEQTALLGSALASMNGLLGSPYAELLWCQAVGALLVGMASELLYAGVLGGLGGLAYGFASGYLSALRGSARLVLRCGAGAASALVWLAARAVKRGAAAAAAVRGG